MNGFLFKRLVSNHRRDGAGSSVTWCFAFRAAHLNVERSVGVYGYPETVSYGVRWWWA